MLIFNNKVSKRNAKNNSLINLLKTLLPVTSLESFILYVIINSNIELLNVKQTKCYKRQYK